MKYKIGDIIVDKNRNDYKLCYKIINVTETRYAVKCNVDDHVYEVTKSAVDNFYRTLTESEVLLYYGF